MLNATRVRELRPALDRSRLRLNGVLTTRSMDGARNSDYDRLYDFRFRDVDQAKRQEVWNEIGLFIIGYSANPRGY